jgi:addiction module HigA family antidote
MENYKTLNKEGKEITADVSLHPGEILEMELTARGIKKSLFAKEIGMSASHFSELLHGKRHLNASIAVKLEQLFDIPAEYWMRVQVYYDIFLERNKNTEAA